MKIKREYLSRLLIVFCTFFGLSRLISITLNLLGFDLNVFTAEDIAYYDALIELITFSIVIYLYRISLKKDLILIKLNKKDYINKLLNLFLIFLAVKIGSSILSSVLLTIFGFELTDSENQNIIVSLTREAPLIMCLSSCILAPIVEEGIFRLSLKKVISDKRLFIILSGLIFGFMHIFPTDINILNALIQSISYVAAGLFLAYSYVKTDNIWIAIILHALNNILSMLAILALV